MTELDNRFKINCAIWEYLINNQKTSHQQCKYDENGFIYCVELNKEIFELIKITQYDTFAHSKNTIFDDNPQQKYIRVIAICQKIKTPVLLIDNLDTKIIAHLIKTQAVDINFVDDNRDTCLTNICHYDIKLEVIKYLIETHKMNFNHGNRQYKNCLLLSCYKNTNLEVIKFLIEDCKMDIEWADCYGQNCLLLANHNKNNVNIIKYLIETHKMDVNYCNDDGGTCLIYAFGCKSLSLSPIKYLIEDCKINVNHVDEHGNNYLMIACRHNVDLDIFKYLVENCKLNINHVNSTYDECLTFACRYANLNIIKYLIENCKMNINIINKNMKSCLTSACHNSEFPEIIKYLLTIENSNILLLLDNLTFVDFKKTMDAIKDHYVLFNKIMAFGIKKYAILQLRDECKKYNPLMFDTNNTHMLNMQNPCDYNYKKFTMLVDRLNCSIIFDNVNVNISQPIKKKEKSRDIDFATRTEKLFTHNNQEYYGHRDVVYKSIIMLNEIMDMCTIESDIVLSGNLPAYVINKYIMSCYVESFDVDSINKEDFMEFVVFIDKYPTTTISISVLEKQIIQFLKKHSIKANTILMEICERYKLKDLYLYFHDQKLIDM